ncbi:MAG TPA: hypothetical protein VGX96_03655 [Candidatus Elarobacter sp.]|jgi:uncharacterized repeat protein (TIGR01451 family)|nr:hypothetical protein [Candidatus Elarobacter sp.]
MRSIAASSLVVLALILPGIAFAKPNVTLKLTGSVVAKAADGKVTHSPLAGAKPGDQIEWDIVAVNAGDTAAMKLATVERVQAGTAYVAGSAHGSHARVEFSLDGRTWSAAPTVTVRRADGTTEVRKADPSLYTALRFVADGALAPKGSESYSYEVRVK